MQQGGHSVTFPINLLPVDSATTTVVESEYRARVTLGGYVRAVLQSVAD